jgi:hypothetical protein
MSGKLIKSEDLVKSIVGEEGYETLEKAISKMNTRSMIDITELHSSLKIVPKAIMSFLLLHMKSMKAGDNKTLDLPWAENCHILINKRDQDVYSGRIDKNGRIEHEFDQVSIPQLATHILSYFEMYDDSNEDSSDYEKLDKKINTLLTLLTAIVIGKKITADGEESRKEESSIQESAIEKAEQAQKKSKKSDFISSLKKATTTGAIKTNSKMPNPPKAGAKVGGNNGITKQGIHAPKTASSDMPGHPAKTGVANPDLKVSAQGKSMFKLPKMPKLMASEDEPKHIPQITLTKGEYNSKCMDCGSKLSQCQCFNGFSKPTVIDKKDKVELKFKDDWNSEAVLSLVRSIKIKKG